MSKEIVVTIGFAGEVFEAKMKVSAEYLKDEHALRQLKNRLETNGTVFAIEEQGGRRVSYGR